MARSGAGIVLAIARNAARYRRQVEASRRRVVREAEATQKAALRAEREYARSLKEQQREDKARYVEEREQEAADLNAEIVSKLSQFENLLLQTLSVDDAIPFDSLRILESPPTFTPPEELVRPEDPPNEQAFLDRVPPRRWFDFLVPWSRRDRERAIERARESYRLATASWQERENRRLGELDRREGEHDRATQAMETKKAQRNAEVDAFESDYRSANADAIVAYTEMVLERSAYPEDFPRARSVAYTEASKQVVVEFELPTVSIVPEIVEHRYVRSGDTINEKPRKSAEIRGIYQDVIASVTLRTIHEIFESDQGGHVQAICLNGYIHTVDPATGRDIQPHLISVRTTKEKFSEIDLSRIDKRVCLRSLGARVSRQPDEAQPVKPIVEFNMADARFVDQTDLVSGLSSATNLMDLTPAEFEHLVANLFGKMGLETKLTRSSRDGGVDCVAYDPRPVLGGKVVIQAKRYKNTVGVSAVRDLFGTMMNEGANKGILVTTSGYGPDAFEFSKDKPIELIEGGGLLFLLQEIGVQARITFPEDS